MTVMGRSILRISSFKVRGYLGGGRSVLSGFLRGLVPDVVAGVCILQRLLLLPSSPYPILQILLQIRLSYNRHV